MDSNIVEQIQSNSHIWKTVGSVVLINILLAMAILYNFKSAQMNLLANNIMELNVPNVNDTVLHVGLIVLVSLVVGYVTYTNIRDNVDYENDVVSNLKLHYSDVKNIGISLVPLALAYVLGSGLVQKVTIPGINDSIDSDELDIVAKMQANTSERSIDTRSNGLVGGFMKFLF